MTFETNASVFLENFEWLFLLRYYIHSDICSRLKQVLTTLYFVTVPITHWLARQAFCVQIRVICMHCADWHGLTMWTDHVDWPCGLTMWVLWTDPVGIVDWPCGYCGPTLWVLWADPVGIVDWVVVLYTISYQGAYYLGINIALQCSSLCVHTSVNKDKRSFIHWYRKGIYSIYQLFLEVLINVLKHFVDYTGNIYCLFPWISEEDASENKAKSKINVPYIVGVSIAVFDAVTTARHLRGTTPYLMLFLCCKQARRMYASCTFERKNFVIYNHYL